jgi:transitional endoplasmic reticulum ATPase
MVKPALAARLGDEKQASRLYVAGSLAILGLYAALAALLLATADWKTDGPGSLSKATQNVPDKVVAAAKDADSSLDGTSIVGVEDSSAPGGPLWIVYGLQNGGVYSAQAIDANALIAVNDYSRLKDSGAWQYLGLVKSPGEWILGAVALIGILFATYRWGLLRLVRRSLSNRSPVASPIGRLLSNSVVMTVLLVFFIGFLVLPFAPGWNRERKMSWAFRAGSGWALLFLIVAVTTAYSHGDPESVAATTVIALTTIGAWLYGWLVLSPLGLKRLPALAAQAPAAPAVPVRAAASNAVVGAVAPQFSGSPLQSPPRSTPQSPPASAPVATRPAVAIDSTSPIDIVTPDRLPNFAQVGGMESLKSALRESVGILLAYPDEAQMLKVQFNGILLFGPPGTGKTFIAKATAGEYGLNFAVVSASELMSSFRGESAQRVLGAFRTASDSPPCLLFFDEFDAVARRRDDGSLGGEDRATLSQLLRSLEGIRERRDVLVMAATNDLAALDPAAIRPGRFDRQIRVDMPDAAARKAILQSQLQGRPVDPTLDFDDLAERCKGFSAAKIRTIVDGAALTVLQAIASGDRDRRITQADIVAAIAAGRGKDRPTFEQWTWDDLILPDPTKRELQELERLIEAPDRAKVLGITPPTGALLYGPPGTGKTTVARVLAAQAKCSFYPVKGSEVVSKWLGESERNVADLFARARTNAPSIVFIDEIDALVPRRSDMVGGGAIDRVVNQLLQEIDGLGSGGSGVFVLGATNRPDILDPALLRGGRLGRQINIPLPMVDERCQMLKLFTKHMPLATDVSCDRLASETDGYSGADLQALCQEAGVQALLRDADATSIAVSDFETAIKVRSTQRAQGMS